MLVVVLLLPLVCGQNLIKNGGMESLTNWECAGFHCEVTSDHHSGQHGIKASGRSSPWHGPAQFLPDVKPNGRYKVVGYIKLLNDAAGSIGATVDLMIDVHFTNGKALYFSAGRRPLATATDGWIHLIGDFNVPSQDVSYVRLYYQCSSIAVNFVSDDVSVTPMVDNPNWKSEADAVIDRIRKSDINFHVSLPHGITPNQVEIDVIQTKKSFPFGTAVALDEYLHGNTKYQNFINKHFNWAVTENALKWNVMEPQQGHINYKLPIDGINKLRSHGIKVRAHNIVWSIDNQVPNWVRPLAGNTLRDTVKRRIQDVVSRTKDLVEHWDVNNENLQGFWYQNTLHDRNYDLEIFRIAHQAGPNVKLFLNEAGVVPTGGLTGAYREQAIRMKNAHVGLYGAGVESHFQDNEYPDPSMIKQHLDTIAEAGVPIWVTEFDLVNADANKRADWYETAMRAFYGHPAVEGILIWGFWSKRHWRGDSAALVSGDAFTINAAGHRFLDLIERQWMTHENHTLSITGNNFKVRGFHGDYEIRVKVNGNEVTSLIQHFTLDKSPHTVTLHVHQ